MRWTYSIYVCKNHHIVSLRDGCMMCEFSKSRYAPVYYSSWFLFLLNFSWLLPHRIHWTLALPWRRAHEWTWMQRLSEMLRTTSTLPGGLGWLSVCFQALTQFSFTVYKEDTSKVIRVRCFSFSLVANVSRPYLRVQEANFRLGPEGCTTEQV